jgi:D-alanyl-D-alanine carboxypeptidase
LKKYFKWKNTNKLLDDGWEGVKTGTTDTAGHCLMAKKDRYLIAVFDSKTLTKRFTECSQLYELVKSK